MRQRRAFAEDAEVLGPDAPTLCARWSALDLAAHLASLDRFAGLPTFLGRSLVGRLAVRLNDPADRYPPIAELAIRGPRRRGFTWALDRLRADPPRLLLRPSVRSIGLFEIWVHHQDLVRANSRTSGPAPDMSEAVPWLLRYQRRRMRGFELTLCASEGHEWRRGHGRAVKAVGPVPELVLWLAGRTGAAHVELVGDPDATGELAASLRV